MKKTLVFLTLLSLLATGALAQSPHSENFDALTPPNAPSNFTLAGSWATTTGGTPNSAPNDLTTSTTAAVATAFYSVQDGAGGNAPLSTNFKYTDTSGHEVGVILRSSSTAWAGDTAYYADLSIGAGGTGVGIVKRISGTNTVLTNGGTEQYVSAFAANVWYNVTLNPSGTSLSMQVKRLSDGLYLQSGGTWGSTPANVYSITDSAITAASGYAGVFVYNVSTATVYVDDFTLGIVSASLIAPGTPTFGAATGSSVVVNWAASTGGTGPYTYQAQLAPDVAGAPGTWANSGGSTGTLTQTVTGLTGRRKYWFRVSATDSAGTPATATSAAAFATTGAPVLTGVRFYHQFFAPYGPYATGLGLGYTAYDGYGNVLIAHTTSGVTEQSGTGIYSVSLAFDTSQSGILVWDAPPGSAPWTEAIAPTPTTGTTNIISNPFQPRRGR